MELTCYVLELVIGPFAIKDALTYLYPGVETGWFSDFVFVSTFLSLSDIFLCLVPLWDTNY